MPATHNPLLNVDIPVPGLRLSGIRHNEGKPVRCLCLHGWLDNANSFVPLMPLLPDVDLVALDLPGHGHSDHFQAGHTYTLTGNAHFALAAAEALGWDSFHLIGHSMGGTIAPFATIAAGARVQSLTMIEALGPRTEEAAQLPARLTRFHREMSNTERYASRLLKSPADAVASRLRAATMSTDAAQLIIDRQITPCEGGYRWRFDAALRIASPSYFTEAHVHAVLGGIECPTLCLLAENGYIVNRAETAARQATLKNLRITVLPGDHHLHMDTPQIVADELIDFLAGCRQ